MENLKFDTMHLKQLVDTSKFDEAKAYIGKFFFTSGPNIFFFDGNTFILEETRTAINRIPNDIKFKSNLSSFDARQYIKNAEFMANDYTPTIDFSKGRFFVGKHTVNDIEIETKFVNMAKPFAIDVTKKVKKHKDIKLIYDHIFNIWCSKNEEMNTWVLNFIACTLGGRKLRKAIYSQCSERCGRGTIIEFLSKILGNAVWKTNSVETITKYTKPFEGTLLLNLDEMPVDGGNFKSIADACKGLITESTFTCRDMHKTPYTQKNTFNIIITTNNDAVHLTQTNNARYCCPDVDESMRGNVEYFTKLNNATNVEAIQIQFYNEMIERFKTLGDWNEDVMPTSNFRQQKINDALPRLYKYMKEEYILCNKNFTVKTKDFFDQYQTRTKDTTSKQKLGRQLSKINILPIKVKKGNSQFYKYDMCHSDLKAIFEKNSWIDPDDQFEYESDDDEYIEQGVYKGEQSVNINLFLKRYL
jgi:hypothetical protein